MAGKARMRFIARQNNLRFDRDSGYYREYFPNAKKPQFGGYVCRDCK
jgi:hypothetical protein